MDTLFGFTGNDFAVLVSDCYFSYSILRVHESVDKLLKLADNKILGIAGCIGESKQFGHAFDTAQSYQLTLSLVLHSNDYIIATLIDRNQLATALRKNPYRLDLLVAGFDKKLNRKPQLFWIDMLASMCELDFAAHGYGANFLWSIFDYYYKKDGTREEAMELIKKCINELSTRFLIAPDRFVVKFIGVNGVEEPIVVEATQVCDKKPLPQLTSIASSA